LGNCCTKTGSLKGKEVRPRLSLEEYEAFKKFQKDVSISTTTKTNSYESEPSMPSAWDKGLNRFLDINEYCDKFGLDKNQVASSKLVSHNAGHMVYNIHFKTGSEIDEFNLESHLNKAFNKYSKRRKSKNRPKRKTKTFDRLIQTDSHIAMDTNKDGVAMYATPWNKQEVIKRVHSMIDECIDLKRSNVIYVDHLGDHLDGWNGLTTRGGHALPQNMSNPEAFDLGVDYFMIQAERLSEEYELVVFNIITNDNHSGDFGDIVARSFKRLAETIFDNVEVVIHRSFINHYFVGFVLTHGKDDKTLKFGFKPKLDDKQIKKIDGYLKENEIYGKAKFIEFSKGDSHQALFDYSTSQDFFYCNYPAFSPSSEWVQNNFQKGISGYVLQNVDYKARRYRPDLILF